MDFFGICLTVDLVQYGFFFSHFNGANSTKLQLVVFGL